MCNTDLDLDLRTGAKQPGERQLKLSVPAFRARDYVLVPLLSFATVILMFAAAEMVTRLIYPEKDYEACRVQGATDPRRAKANCVVSAKDPEGPWVTYKLNECGYRTPDSCGAKPSGAIRLALLGASMTMGKNVPLDQTWGERTARALSKASGRKVEVENLGWELLSPLNCYRQLKQVVGLKPDLVVYAVNPYDLNRTIDPKQIAHRDDPDGIFPHETPLPVYSGFNLQNGLRAIHNAFEGSRAVFMAQHFLFSNPETYLRIYLADGSRADYVRQPFSPVWQTQFAEFRLLITEMASRLRQAGVPFVVIGLPARAQVILLRDGKHINQIDPLAFDHEIETICLHAGVAFVPTTEEFSRISGGDKLFYVIDQHITPDGNAIIARQLIRKCLDGSIPGFTPNVIGNPRPGHKSTAVLARMTQWAPQTMER